MVAVTLTPLHAGRIQTCNIMQLVVASLLILVSLCGPVCAQDNNSAVPVEPTAAADVGAAAPVAVTDTAVVDQEQAGLTEANNGVVSFGGLVGGVLPSPVMIS